MSQDISFSKIEKKEKEVRGKVSVSTEHKESRLQPRVSPVLFSFPKLWDKCCSDGGQNCCCTIFAESFSQKIDI